MATAVGLQAADVNRQTKGILTLVHILQYVYPTHPMYTCPEIYFSWSPLATSVDRTADAELANLPDREATSREGMCDEFGAGFFVRELFTYMCDSIV